MNIDIRDALAEEIGKKKLVPFGLSEDGWRWHHKGRRSIDLMQLGPKRIRALEALLTAHKDSHGVQILLKDIERWIEAINAKGKVRPRTIKQFEPMLIDYLSEIPGHRIFSHEDGDIWLAYYVEEIHYTPPSEHHAAYVTMDLWWEEFGGKRNDRVVFYSQDCAGATVVEALARKGYYAENDELRAQYLKEIERFGDLVPRIGKQFYAHGVATDDVDGNPGGRQGSWYWSRTNYVKLGTFDAPSRCVIDVFRESDKEERERDKPLNVYFWDKAFKKKLEDEDEDADDELPEIDKGEREPIEIPIHPNLCIFHLAKHLRIRCTRMPLCRLCRHPQAAHASQAENEVDPR